MGAFFHSGKKGGKLSKDLTNSNNLDAIHSPNGLYAPDDNHKSLSLLLITVTWPPVKGGAENYLFEIYRRLSSCRLTVLTSQQPGDAEFDARQPWHTIRVPLEWFTAYWQGRRKRLVLLVELHRIIQKNDINLVVTGFAFPDGLVAWLLKQIYGLPYVTHFYGVDFLSHLGNPLWRHFIMQIFQDADYLIGCSTYSRDKVVEMGIQSAKIHTVFPGVDVHRFHPVDRLARQRIRRELGLPEDAPILLTISRLVARKGHDYVLLALRRILKRYPMLVYVIVGEGRHRDALYAMVKEHNLSDNVRFVGEVADKELPLFYQAADLFIMPNRDINGDVEGFGIVFIEASASGIPVIGGKSGGARDAIEHGSSGVLVNPVDVEEISNVVIQILSNESSLSNMGRLGRQMVEDKYSWERATTEVEKVIWLISQSGIQRRPGILKFTQNAMREMTRPCRV